MTRYPDDLISVSHAKLARVLKVSDIDFLLISLAVHLMKTAGHRYGNFLEAASTAAKLAVYSTYLEQGHNLRKTGFLHHIEPRRVKIIVNEIEEAMANGQSLKMLGSQEPQYLIGIPHLWVEKYPLLPGSSRIQLQGVGQAEKEQLEAGLPGNLPDARVLTEEELQSLIHELHVFAEQDLPESRKTPFTDPLLEHIKFRLLHSGTIARIQVSSQSVPLYVLLRKSYSPRGRDARGQAMTQDLIRFFRLLQLWMAEDPNVLRGIETLTIRPEDKQQALSELDKLIQDWADKYHCEGGGDPVVLEMAAGPYENLGI